jgi:hypothetical protein
MQGKMQGQLQRVIKEFSAKSEPFEAVLEKLQELAGITFLARWKPLESAGIERQTPVSMEVRNLPLSGTIRILLDHVGGGTANLDFTTADGIIIITTKDDMYSAFPHTPCIYNVRDLLGWTPGASTLSAPRLIDVPTTSAFDPVPSAATAPDGHLFDKRASRSPIAVTTDHYAVDADRLIFVLQSYTTTNVWRDFGGIATITEFRGLLIVEAEPDVQTQIVSLLACLRAVSKEGESSYRPW